MSKKRKDHRGRILQKGEVERKDGRYAYSYTDPLGRRKFIYALNLSALREKEKQLLKDQLDGLDIYKAGKITVNVTFDRYISIKQNLRDSTRSNYLYTYDHFVRETFGRRKIGEIRYSDVVRFYYYLLNEKNLTLGTLDTVHCILHPTFQLAVRDNIIRTNPADGAMGEVRKNSGKSTCSRRALTINQQQTFMDYIANHPVYFHWWPMMTILLGTGCRIGEALGLRWEDLDFDQGVISINHTLVYYPASENRKLVMRISPPKSNAGIRTIPMLDSVRNALNMLREEQEELGYTKTVIDGMSGFIFRNRCGEVPNPQSVNRTIKRITGSYNAEEKEQAKREHREPILLPDFSAHNLRHTFCTRLCENETNLKVIQAVMGHSDIQTTMNIYAEATEEKKRETFDMLSAKLDIF